jgi:hypothetical protein
MTNRQSFSRSQIRKTRFDKVTINDLYEFLSRDVATHNTEGCESRVLMIERSQR